MTLSRSSAVVIALLLAHPARPAAATIEAIPEHDLGWRVAVTASQIVWKVDSDLPKELMVYKTKPRHIADRIIPDLASKFSLKARAVPTGFGLGEPTSKTFANEAGDKYVTYHPDYSGFELYVADKSGFHYDKKSKKPIVEGLLSNDEALRRSIELLPTVGLSTNDLYLSEETGYLYSAASCNQVGFTDPETKEHQKLCTNTRIKFMHQIGGHKVYGFGGGGCAEFIYVSHGELASVTWLIREAVPFVKMELRDRDSILAAIRKGECFSWTNQEMQGETLSVTAVEVDYYEGNEHHRQEYFLPLYVITCQLAQAGGARDVHLLLPALK